MKLITHFLPTLMATAVSLTKNKHDAEDLLQDVAYKLLLKKDKIEAMPEEEQRKYAFVMLRNGFIDLCRKKKEFTSVVPEKAIRSEAETLVEAKEVRAAMGAINKKHSAMLDMSLQGYKTKEIAKAFDVSPYTVLSGMRYGKNAVRAAMA